MRTTVRIEADLLRELKKRAQQEKISMTQLLNQVVRRGLLASDKPPRARRFRQRTSSLGPAFFNVDKALSVAAAMEDEEIIRKMMLGK